ncbi:MAG: Lrp/AsnC family transcriptional regulator [Firmicutes bacterium]|nr:Lrp/AsnC family transcriptional regulator [Bacillota bacterium]
MADKHQEILELLEKDSTLQADQLAAMLDMSLEEVRACIDRLEKDGTIVGYKAVVNWDNEPKKNVTALIELKISPQAGTGFEKVAERISRYPQVQSVLLMSGGFDLAVQVEEKSLDDVAHFVWEKLASMDGVVSTATHFVLKKYKEDGISLFPEPEDDRVRNVLI